MGGLKIISAEYGNSFTQSLLIIMRLKKILWDMGVLWVERVSELSKPYDTPMDCHNTGDGAANPFGLQGGTPGIGGGNYRKSAWT